MLTCPVCDADIDVEEVDLDEGESVGCDECGAILKVRGKNPVELYRAGERVEEDDDEIYDDEEIEDLDELEEDEEEDDEWR